ncbi:hypothetical protein ABZ826_23415 [Streptomyces sp. NPDC047515]|uniref:hypothetical protein n=1 Tax=Streptomyces sp. NPDC047515 TaxID=3155380 RepID=UPI0033F8A402
MTTGRPKRLTEAKARSIADGATLVKAADWSATHAWDVVAEDGTVLVIVTPSYGGGARSGRNGWKYHLASLGPSGNRDHWPTRQQAATQGLMAWMRWVTAAR